MARSTDRPEQEAHTLQIMGRMLQTKKGGRSRHLKATAGKQRYAHQRCVALYQ